MEGMMMFIIKIHSSLATALLSEATNEPSKPPIQPVMTKNPYKFSRVYINERYNAKSREKFRHPLRPPSASFTQGMDDECFKLNCSPRIISFICRSNIVWVGAGVKYNKCSKHWDEETQELIQIRCVNTSAISTCNNFLQMTPTTFTICRSVGGGAERNGEEV